MRISTLFDFTDAALAANRAVMLGDRELQNSSTAEFDQRLLQVPPDCPYIHTRDNLCGCT